MQNGATRSRTGVDFRGIQDAFAQDRGIDYCENSRRATYVHREYAIRNPLESAGYGENFWGLTASDGPGPTTQTVMTALKMKPTKETQ